MLVSLQIIVHVTVVVVAQGSAKRKKKKSSLMFSQCQTAFFGICVSRPYHSCSWTLVICFSSDTLTWSGEVGKWSNLSACLALVINLHTGTLLNVYQESNNP